MALGPFYSTFLYTFLMIFRIFTKFIQIQRFAWIFCIRRAHRAPRRGVPCKVEQDGTCALGCETEKNIWERSLLSSSVCWSVHLIQWELQQGGCAGRRSMGVFIVFPPVHNLVSLVSQLLLGNVKTRILVLSLIDLEFRSGIEAIRSWR